MNCDKVLSFFEEINKIPRGSGNEKQVSDFLVQFAKERNLWVHQDKANNVIIKKPASKGYENHKTVVIQGHMDMVLEKNEDVIHNFETDPIKVIYDGDFIHADGTTLGADNGIAVAMGMALLDDKDAIHPPLEVLITTDEEVGMIGASNLDGTLIDGRILLNIDSEVEGIFTVGCAGGVKIDSKIPIEFKDSSLNNFVKVSISGLEGGHSGIDIDKERANSNKLLGRLVERLISVEKIEVASLSGGAKDNAIPRYAEVICGCKDVESLKTTVNIFFEEIKNEYINSESNIVVDVVEFDRVEKVIDDRSIQNVISAINLMPNGIQSSNVKLNMPESSNNLGVVKMNENYVSLVCALRSASITKKAYLKDNIKRLILMCGGSVEFIGEYPAWEYKPESEIRDLYISLYKEMYNKEPKVETIHAGLECGLISEKIPDMDMVSFGPNLYDIHTPRERASISSIERVWNFLCESLKRI